MFFKRFEKRDKLKVLYDIFLDNIDATSQIRLRGFDMSLNNLKNKLNDKYNLNLTEIDCMGNKILIKRNKSGFYLVKDNDLEQHKTNLKVYHKIKDDLMRIHNYLLEKESIMNGNYSCNKRHKIELESISSTLGYGEKREAILDEKKD